MDPAQAKKLRAIIDEPKGPDDWSLGLLMEWVIHLLNGHVPPYSYFGLIDGDYGVWPAFDALEMAASVSLLGDVLRVEAGEEWPSDVSRLCYIYEVDGQRVTLFNAKTRKEEWSSHTELVPAEHGARALTSLSDLDALVSEGKRSQGGDGITSENMRAFSLFSQAAFAGHSEAQYLLYECYHLGRGVKQDEAQALAWLRKSAESGFVKALIFQAFFYQHSVPKNDEEAIKWYQKAAEAGSSAACILIAGIYKDRNDVAGELRWNKEAALRGYADSLWDVRKFYERRDGAEIDLPDAYAWLSLYEDSFTTRKNSEEAASFQFSPDISRYKTTSPELKALMSVSQLEQGNQLYQDLAKQRVTWIRKKAEEGSTDAQYDLGWCYRHGSGVLQDDAEAVRWWRIVAEQGHARAQNDLGHCYKYAEGVKENHEEAVRWFRKAAEQSHTAAEYSLGHSYCMGLGVPKDYNEGVKWIRRSAEAGNTTAQHGMGFLCNHGYGVPQDNAQALAWYRCAAAQGNANAQKEANSLAVSMSPTELERASQLYREFKDKYSE